MIDEQSKIKKILFLSIASMAAIIVISVILMSIQNSHQNDQKVIIANLDTCTKNISEYSKQNLFSSLYAAVNADAEISDQAPADSYSASLREDSCSTKTYNSDTITTYSTKAIIDIDDYGFSYKINFYWVTTNNRDIDLGIAEVYCLPSSHPSCTKNPLITEELDDVASLMPYFGNRYTLSLTTSPTSKSGYAIIVELDPSESTYLSGDVEAFANGKLSATKNYLQSNDLNPDNYEFIIKYKIVR